MILLAGEVEVFGQRGQFFFEDTFFGAHGSGVRIGVFQVGDTGNGGVREGCSGLIEFCFETGTVVFEDAELGG